MQTPPNQDCTKPTVDTAKVALFVSEVVRHKMFPAATLDRIRAFAQLHIVDVSTATPDAARAELVSCDAVISGWHSPPLSSGFLDQNPQLRFFGYIGASIRHLLPLEQVENGRLVVSHAAVHIAEAVAEFTIAQMLEHLKRTRAQDEYLKAQGDWKNGREEFIGHHLGALTVGIVGTGYIGRLVIGLLKAFGSNVIVYDPYLTDEAARILGVARMDLVDLMSSAQIVSLHAPVLPETRHMINDEMIACLQDGALLINTARSAIIDEAALATALRSRPITAAIDVFDAEPLPDDSPFRTLPNAILSPHTAGHTWETYLRQGNTIVDEVQRFLTGQPLQHQVTPAMLLKMA